MAATFTYPPMPQGIDEKIIQPSAAFKQEVFKVTGAILFFIITYVVLVGVALGFAAICGISAFLMVTSSPGFITLMVGLGLVGLGLMVVYFMFKFVFSRNKVDRSGMVEITEAEQPELFSFIRKLAQETQTPFPKRIYLTPDVNASVFYDSGFWSMFLPIRKNLMIGLGLVNCVNVSEFKAILAHEFGHFSQRSMKLGSYVYNVNKILYNMLYDNEGFANALGKWGNANGYFAFFASITVKVVQLFQWILQKVYLLVNRQYKSLSRQMEFHADAVAAYVTGSGHLITSLRRLEAADMCYNRLFSQYDLWLKENLKPDNIYPQHTAVMTHLGNHLQIPMQHGLLQVNAQTFALFNQSRLVIKDQWASHPSTDDREAHLRKLNIASETVHAPAWSIFRNAETLQQEMTGKIYAEVSFTETPQIINLVSFQEKYSRELKENSFHPLYKGFYDNRDISSLHLAELIKNTPDNLTLEELLQDTNTNLPALISSLKSDIETLAEIRKGDTGIKNIDFDGRKYKYTDAYVILSQLTEELKAAEEQLEAADRQLFQYFYHQAVNQGKGAELETSYKNLFEITKQTEADFELYNKIVAEMHPLFTTPDMTIEHAHAILDEVRNHETQIRSRMQQVLADGLYLPYYTARQKEKLEAYLQAENRPYLVQDTFDSEAIDLLQEATSIWVTILADRTFQVKKSLLEAQAELVAAKSVASGMNEY